VGPEPASGTLTFLFTDVEGSTRLWEGVGLFATADLTEARALLETSP
jgi:class 3 adenylate cyclase